MFRHFFIFNYLDAALAWYFAFCAYVDKVREGCVTSIFNRWTKKYIEYAIFIYYDWNAQQNG